MSKKLITIFIILTIVTLLGIITMESRRVQIEDQNIENIINSKNPIYYYGITCPYCRELEKFIEENGIEEKITLVKKEVYENQTNSMELKNIAEYCKINSDGVGLPFIYANKKCYMGLDEIEKYFSDNFLNLEVRQSTETKD